MISVIVVAVPDENRSATDWPFPPLLFTAQPAPGKYGAVIVSIRTVAEAEEALSEAATSAAVRILPSFIIQSP